MSIAKFPTAISNFGKSVKAKLSSPVIQGEPEDQLRNPLEILISDLAEVCGLDPAAVRAIGETSLSSLKTRPDFAVTLEDALIGFIEVKAPGKGADPRRFKDKHDRSQWDKLQPLPNLVYTDGNEFSLWRNGELAGGVVRLVGDIETSGAELSAPHALVALFEDFFRWQPIAPRSARELAVTSARLCRLLREEVAEQLAHNNPALTALAEDWRQLLFPEATDAQFADGYAQTVTFGLLMARSREIRLHDGFERVARELAETNTLIGAALRFLTDNAANKARLSTSLRTLTRVLDAVEWSSIARRGEQREAWLYFYEQFLEVYDNDLRKKTGSYYTPPPVVSSMVAMVDEALRTRFGLHSGIASPGVTIADPAVGTGTFLLEILRRIAETIERDEGAGSVPEAINAASAVGRLVGFELQLGPFAVAQLRILAELHELIGHPPAAAPRMFVADTLSDPYGEPGWFPSMLAPLGESRKQANRVKLDQPITVVIGNPPYKEKAKGRGGWVESGSENSPESAPLDAWMPPAEWGVGAHAKHLRNLYVYFWRWATWKVFDHDPNADTGIVCFITVSGFLNGPGFQRMRDYLRRKADEIWVIDCSPEGHQPEVATRIFQGVQQPVCIVLAARSPRADESVPAAVRFRSLPVSRRDEKFAALQSIGLDTEGWTECATEWRAPFLPATGGDWSTFAPLEDLFVYNGSGVMPGRTWIIAPDAESLRERWNKLVNAPEEKKEELFHPHLAKDGLGDRHVNRKIENGLPGFPAPMLTVAQDRGPVVTPIRYGFRSFDRQWIIPDNRLINRPNPRLWQNYSDRQVYLTALTRTSPTSGPAITFSAFVPDLDHYKGSFGGRVFPLWADRAGVTPNIRPGLLAFLSERFGRAVDAPDVMAYIAAVAAHPAFTEKFKAELVRPGIRVPLTAEAELFERAAAIGREVIWLHTFGERFADRAAGRPPGPPRLPQEEARPFIPQSGAIPREPMPDSLRYDEQNRRLLIGDDGGGYVENVGREVWEYEVSGKQVLRQWFSYRKRDRSRPIIGDRRQPSPLGDIQPDHWLAEYTTELINLLNILGRLVELEPAQAELLERICGGELLAVDALNEAGAFAAATSVKGDERFEPLFEGH